MKLVEGKFTSAKIFTDNVENYALAQIQNLCDNEVFKDCKIRVMPDVHPGKVSTIGFTSTLGDKIMPNVVGSDIGCGIAMDILKDKNIDFRKLDVVIRDYIPTGFNIRNKVHKNFSKYCEIFEFNCPIDLDKYEKSLGTLGGGNHFIEVDKNEEGMLFLTVHSGSRYLGERITNYYLNEGQFYLKSKGIDVQYELTWLEGELMEKYIQDVIMATRYAQINRLTILEEIEKRMKLTPIYHYDRYHNTISRGIDGNWYIRKGAISSEDGETVIIPINMKDGIILGTGLGNPDWNYSAPHGAGRIMNRENVKNNFTVSQFKNEMKGIHCSCIGKGTLDEAPFAYRGLEEIKETIKDTVIIDEILKPVYNYKAGNEK